MKIKIIRSEAAYSLALTGNVLACIVGLNSIIKFVLIIGIDMTSFFLLLNSSRKLQLRHIESQLIILYLIGQCTAYLISFAIGYPITFDLHRVFLFILTFSSFYIMSKHCYLPEKSIDRLLKVFLSTGLVSFVYDFIINRNRLSQLASDLMYIRYNGNYFKSFFNGRTECAFHAFLCIIVCLYFISKSKQKRYYVYMVLMLVHIIFTSARMPLAMAVISMFVMFILDVKLRKNIKWLVLLVLLLIGINISSIIDFYNNFIIPYLTHSGHGNGTMDIRFRAWTALIQKGNILQLFTGYGMGSQTVLTSYFDPTFLPQSYHCMYVDYLCQGGVVLVGIVLVTVIDTARRIYRSNMDKSLKYFFITLMICYLGSMLTDSVGALYDFAVFSTMSTALVIGLARVAAYSAKVDAI